VVNILTGYLVDKVSVRVLVGSSAFITAVAPLILALSRDSWSYWEGIFVGDALAPVNPDGKLLKRIYWEG